MEPIINLEEIKIDKPVEEKKIDFDDLHNRYLVDLSLEVPPPPIAMSIGDHEFRGNLYPTTVASYGDFSVIVGESKAKKSFLKSLFVARYLGGNSHEYGSEIKAFDTQGKYVIDVDTEQGEYHSQKTFRRVAQMTNELSPLYKPFRLRPLSPRERLEFLDYLFFKSQYRNKIGLVVIDGIADLVKDINDIEESTMVIQKLMTWSEYAKCHIITVLHLNPGSVKPKGHLGTFAMQKCESIIRVKREDATRSSVTADYARNFAFDPFEIEIQNGLPYYTGQFEPIPDNFDNTF